jgi:hypothetical protein
LTAGAQTGPAALPLYPHFQLDAQATMHVASGFSVPKDGLNLTNEVFGFYNGSPQYVVQREFYKPTVAFGIRYIPPSR